MDPEIRNFKEIEQFIKEHPKEADALAAQWQNFVRQNPEAASFEKAEEFYEWASQKHIDPSIWTGKEVAEAYFYLRNQHEYTQMQAQGGVNPSVVPLELLALPLLALAFQDRTKLMENDKDYQNIAEEHRKLWLEKNPGEDFTGKKGLGYLCGSLDDANAPTLKTDTEQAFRENPKFKKRVEGYDRERKKLYKNPDEDPAFIRTKNEIEEHKRVRSEYLKTHDDNRTQEETNVLIQKRAMERFVRQHPEKASKYRQTNIDVKKAYEKEEIKKQLADIEQKTGRQIRYVEKTHRPQGIGAEEASRRLESIIPPQPRSIIPEQQTTIAQTEGSSDRGRGNETNGTGRKPQPPRRRTVPGLGRLGTRLIIQTVASIGRTLIGAFLTNPMGWIAVGLVVVIMLIVLLIILLGSGGFGGNRVPTFECVDADGNRILVTNGNACADNYAAFYSRQTGQDITAKCLDKCTDNITIVCDRNPDTNRCDPPPLSCGATEHFCFEYSISAPRDQKDHSLWRHDCSNLDGFDFGGTVGFTVDSCSMMP